MPGDCLGTFFVGKVGLEVAVSDEAERLVKGVYVPVRLGAEAVEVASPVTCSNSFFI